MSDRLDVTPTAIGERIISQDNQCTAFPMFLVQQRHRLYGFDTRWVGDVGWLRDGEEVDASETQALEEKWGDSEDEPAELTRTGFVDEWVFVTCCFTQAAADEFIAVNRHRLTDPRVYVDSAYRNQEWNAVREHLLTLASTGGDR